MNPVLTLFVTDHARHRRCTLRLVRGMRIGRALASIILPCTTPPKSIRRWALDTRRALEANDTAAPTWGCDTSVVDDLIPYDPPEKK